MFPPFLGVESTGRQAVPPVTLTDRMDWAMREKPHERQGGVDIEDDHRQAPDRPHQQSRYGVIGNEVVLEFVGPRC